MSQGNLIWISLTVVIIAVLGYLSSRFILKQQVSSPDLKIDWNFFRTSFQTLKYAKSLPLIFMILLGNSWYWFYGATYLTQIPQLTQQNLHASENVVSLLLTFFSVEIEDGSLLCRRIGGSEVNIKMVPIGAIGLTLFAFYLALSLAFVPERTGAMMNVADMFNHGAIYYHVMLAVTLLGISGGFLYCAAIRHDASLFTAFTSCTCCCRKQHIKCGVYGVFCCIFDYHFKCFED